jgi:hypothetical protein
MKIKSLLITILMIVSVGVNAQQNEKKYTKRKFKKEPLWIVMMDDPSVNYYLTVRAFRDYWKNRVLPKEPFESEEKDLFEKEVGLLKENETEKEREKEKNQKPGPETIRYAAEVRAFKGWMQNVKPWVRQDGSIVSREEQQQILDKQAQELRDIENKNGKK